MIFRTLPALLLSVALLHGQSRTIQLKGPDGKPIIGKDGKPATMTMDVVSPEAALSALPPDKVLITVGDQKVTAGELNGMIESLPEQYRAPARGANRRQFAENIVRLKLLAGEARRRKLDQTASFKTQMAFQEDNILAGLVYRDLAKSVAVPEADVRAWYEQHKGEYERVHARHILIRMKGSPVPVKPEQSDLSEEEALAKAKQLRMKLLAGADFAAVAKAESDDAQSGQQGGDLGWVSHGQMVPSFEEAAFATPAGTLSEPVKSQFGYHIIKVEAKESKSLDELRPEIEKKLRPGLAQKALEQMRKEVPVTLDPAFFGEAVHFRGKR
ncbi:MAG: peptidylprolyl isomerase, partial [Acidobacteria bacterium]|nr:peptidylprolyl isomerase [Acidobacteriota bacterium]